jgi:hypothetical protein
VGKSSRLDRLIAHPFFTIASPAIEVNVEILEPSGRLRDGERGLVN